MDLGEFLNKEEIIHGITRYSHGAEYMVEEGPFLQRNHHRRFECFAPSEIRKATSHCSDIFRSLHDWNSTIIAFDVEIFNIRYPNKPGEDQNYTYETLEALDRCILDIYHELGLNPLSIATGKGYHYVVRVDRFEDPNTRQIVKPQHRMLEEIGWSGLRPDVEDRYYRIRPGSRRKRIVFPEEGAAFEGAGRLLELIAHEIIWRAPYYGVKLPIYIGDVHPLNKDEGIDLDLSCFGDPLRQRIIRSPFSPNQKQHFIPGGNRWAPVGVAILRNVPEHNDLAGGGFRLPLPDMLRLRMNLWDAWKYALVLSTEIPEEALGVERWINAYKRSKLAEFHRAYDQADPNLGCYPWEFSRFHEQNDDFLNPTTSRRLVKLHFNGDPRRDRQTAYYLKWCYTTFHPQDFNWKDDYAPEYKSDKWVRFHAGQLHCGMRF